MSEVPIMVMPWHRPDPCKALKMQAGAAFKDNYLEYLSSLNLDSPPLPVPLTTIACTIGTSSNKVDMMMDLMRHGMSIAVVPLALGVRQDHIDTISNLRKASTAYSHVINRSYPLGIAVQTKGPGLRIGGLRKDVPVQLVLNNRVTLSTDKAWRLQGNENYLYVGFPEMCHVLTKGDVLLVGSAVILQVEIIDENEVTCLVVGGGVIHSFISLSVPDVPIQLPPLTDEDEDDLRLVASLGVDIVVASHTESSQFLVEMRKILTDEDGGAGIKIWAQIESKHALKNLESIMQEADAVLLSRVSLTRDLNPEKLFLAQKTVLASCNKFGCPVYVSSHYLPSMQDDVTPSIAELNDVATTVLDGADGFVLRNTTAIGKYPEHTIKTLSSLCVEAEAAVWHHQTFNYLNLQSPPPVDPTNAIAISAVEASLKASAAAILLATTSGRSAQLLARYRPRCPIIAVTRYGQVARQLNMWRAIIPLHYLDPPLVDWTREVDVRLQFAIEFAKTKGIVNPGDTLVLLNGWRQGAGFTNTIRVVYASESFPWVFPHNLPQDLSDNVTPYGLSFTKEEAQSKGKTGQGADYEEQKSTMKEHESSHTSSKRNSPKQLSKVSSKPSRRKSSLEKEEFNLMSKISSSNMIKTVSVETLKSSLTHSHPSMVESRQSRGQSSQRIERQSNNPPPGIQNIKEDHK